MVMIIEFIVMTFDKYLAQAIFCNYIPPREKLSMTYNPMSLVVVAFLCVDETITAVCMLASTEIVCSSVLNRVVWYSTSLLDSEKQYPKSFLV
jgi:hypothetical protein